MSNKVFVGSIHHDVTDADLERLFSDYGDVVNVTLKKDVKAVDGKEIKRSFAFIEFERDQDVKRALSLDGFSLKGRNIFVKPFDDKKGEKGKKGFTASPVKIMQDKTVSKKYEVKCGKCGETHEHVCQTEREE